MRVCFVCTGNICRSPTAEAVFLWHAAEAGLAVEADSCGISAEEFGNPPDRRAVAEARRRGIHLPDRRARHVGAADFAVPGLLVGMTGAHCRALDRLRPVASPATVHLLLDFVPELRGQDVPDPWYGTGPRAFAEAYDLIEEGVRGMIAQLRVDGLLSRVG
ncbi:MAG: low molecular weight protein-tyrosine-phosphatase [Pseudomonadota bacterium]